MAILATTAIYLPDIFCHSKVIIESIDLPPVRIEPEHKNDILLTVSQIGRAIVSTLPKTNPVENEYHSVSIKVLVTGQVLTDQGFPSSNEKIKIYSPSLGEQHITRSDSAGYFQLDKVTAANDYQLRILPQGMYQRHDETINIIPPFSQFQIRLKTLAVSTLRVQLQNTDGVLINNFKLRVRSKKASRWERLVTTNNMGQFELDKVPVGSLTFSSMHNQVLSIKGYELMSNQNQRLNVIVDEGSYAISGIVINQYGDLVVGANVLLSWKYTEGQKRTIASRRTTTNQDGSFYLQGIGPGWHDLVVADISSGAAHKQSLNFLYNYEEIVINIK